jgi:HSP20 family protein
MLKELRPWVSEALSPWFANRFFQDIDSLFDRFLGDTGYRSLVIPMTGLPAVDHFFKDGNLVVRFDLPGVDPKDIDVSVAGNTLTVKASRQQDMAEEKNGLKHRETSYGRVERSMTLPEGGKAEEIKANYRNGVLELTIPVAPEVGGRKIPIEIGTEERRQLEGQEAQAA